MVEIKQEVVDEIFWTILGNDSDLFRQKDCQRIKSVIFNRLGIELSISEAGKFWIWRSSQWDTSWLSIGPDNEIIEWFNAFYKAHLKN